ncbi:MULTISPECIES: flagellar basal-body MS-ring/collar protein FliF [unclassified Campylobacter]|uniref:flagellar basal-body MS-ring/collar protein FliF n=1 Tax=unclassified Campylobacter TaxID=2593542 RepID=UPI001DFB4128|nr:flagellar basal-body MS-ring/collar protein FliF [Campylobacter sp. RM12651]MBZ7983098.1 flagellar M-ring protein FliF [Campylobacter sp. RM12647]ULO02950.1 flagellar inner membrane MS-ring protein FliF [Campylobacter sp. RM12651]
MIKQFLQGIGKFYSGLEKKQKLTILAAIIATVAFIVFLLVYNSGNNKNYSGYSVLFDELDTKNSAAVVSILEKNQINYILKDESTILVPSADVYKQRLEVASAGILKDNKVGFEIFDKQEFGATDEEQKIKFKRALEGELARTIESLNPINKATVHIAFGKESLFVKEKEPPTASVVLNIKMGMKLGQKQVLGIKNLIASSVAGLSVENVKIIDQNGVNLGADEVGLDVDELNAQINYKKEYENSLEQKIINVLAPVLGGWDRVVARVNADFNFDKANSQSEVFDPNSVARSEQSLEEKKEGKKGKEVGGVPGAISNIGPVQGIEDGENKESYSKNQSTINYEISKKITTIKGQFATLNRISAAVVVDGKYEIDENGEVKYVAISDDELKKLQGLVKNAIGFNDTRGDSVSVDNIRFNNIKAPVPPSIKITNFLESYIMPFIPPAKYIFAMVLMFIFYKKVISPFIKKMLEDKVFTPEELEEIRREEGADDEEDAIEKYQQAKKRVEEQLGIDAGFSEDELQYDILLEKLKTISTEKSDEVAMLFKSLLKNDAEFNQSQKEM